MVTHPYNKGEPIPPDTRVLIVGTAPPPRFDDPKELRGDDFDFFYGSEKNFMWDYLDRIAKEVDGANLFSRTEVVTNGKKKVKYTDSSDRCCQIARSFLRKHHLWMKDILERYERKEGRKHLASDDAIIDPDPPEYTDFRSVLKCNTGISTLAFVSKKAAVSTMKRLADQLQTDLLNEPIRRIRTQKERGEFWEGSILGRRIRFLLLPSPSGRAARPNDDKLYKKFLFNR